MDDPPPPRWLQRHGRPARRRVHPLAAGILLSLALISPPPSRAGLFKPVLQLMRPQLEQRLSRLCLNLASDGNPNLENALRRPCQKLAVPASHCLVEETDASGREMAVIAEILGGKVGAAGEEVLKRCAARLLSLPADSFQAVPLSELGKRLRAARRGGNAPAAPLSPAGAAR